MKKQLSTCTVVITFVLFGVGLVQAEPTSWDSISEKIIKYALNVKPGETVIINGEPTQIEFLGSLQVATEKAGGLPILQLDIPLANKRSLMETPMDYLGQPQLYKIQQMRGADCVIDVRSVQEPGIYADVPEVRLSANRRSADLMNQALKRAHFRKVSIGQVGGIPTKPYAKSQKASYKDMISMFWDSVDVDYDQLKKSGEMVATKLQPDSQVHLVTTSGTDLTFKIGRSPPRINSGRTADNIVTSGVAQVWLPAGETYACTNTTSASGILVVPHLNFRGIPITNIRITFENGRITDFKAEKNAKMLQEFFKFAKGDIGVLSVVDIGLNPNSYPLERSTYISFEMSGVITLGIGNNTWAGCEVESDTGLLMHIKDATLSIDNIPLVENGKLKIAVPAHN